MSVSIDGKTIIITGAASGIGRATAEVLHDMGTNVVLADLHQKVIKYEPLTYHVQF